MKKSNKSTIVDLYFIFFLTVFLLVIYFTGINTYFFKFSFVILLTFYYLGKYARNYEIKHHL